MKKLIKKLVESVGPSGYEDAVREIIQNEIKDYADDIKVDALGNLIAVVGKKNKDGQRIMLSAHMDEIGIVVTHVDENGFVRFAPVGGVFPQTCYGGRVIFVNGTRGVIGGELISSMSQLLPLDKLFVDVGVSSKDDCPVKVGDFAVFDRSFQDLGDRIVSKAMDDRIACAVLVETLKKLKSTPNQVFFVFSVQEEVGLRGATTSAYGVDPEIGISVDVTRTGDLPKNVKMEVSLGNGPTVKVKDSGMLSDPRLVRFMADTAEKSGIPYQLEVLERGTTDARAIQVTRAGVPSSCVSIPCRYVHTPSEMVDINDVQNAVSLLVELMSKPIVL